MLFYKSMHTINKHIFMTKRLFVAISIIAFVLISCNNAPYFKIKGSIKNSDLDKVYLKDLTNGGETTIDSAEIKNNNFVIKRTFGKTKLCGLFRNKGYSGIPMLKLYIENTDVNIDYNSNNRYECKIIGGPNQYLYNKFNDIDRKAEKEQDSIHLQLSNLSQKGELTPKKEKNLNETYTVINKRILEEKIALIEKNTSSLVSADIFNEIYRQISPKKAEQIAKSLTGEAASKPAIREIMHKLSYIDRTAIGQPAPDFTQNTPEGKPLSLSSFKGKLLILQFGASWCKPERAENPNLLRMYKKYHNKGLEILNVSLDKNKDQWLRYIQQDGLIWNHVSDFKMWESPILKLYKVRSVPRSFLIDKNGIIINKDLRSHPLEQKLQEYFGF